MNFVQAVVLGVIQGLTEFLPISSSGHLRVVPALLGWDDPGASFTAVTQLGTMAAVLLYFRRDLWAIATTWLRSLARPELRRDVDARMGWYLIIATVPIVIFGVLFEGVITTGARDLRVIGCTLIGMGLVLYASERVGSRTKALDEIRPAEGVGIGLAQSLALVPGVSRSGATISAGLFMGFTREAAARFSFLLSVPAVVLSGVYEIKDIGSGGPFGPAETALAALLAFGVGYAAIAWLLRYLVSHTTLIFVIYRVALGVTLLVLVAAGTLPASEPAVGQYLTTFAS